MGGACGITLSGHLGSCRSAGSIISLQISILSPEAVELRGDRGDWYSGGGSSSDEIGIPSVGCFVKGRGEYPGYGSCR